MAKEIKVAIQGGTASFHDMAARLYFAAEQINTLACMSFRQLCDALEAGACDYALMAIENTIAGSILTNYSLLQQHEFSIIGERWLPIEQNIMALPGQRLEDITSVFSHPVALLQCGSFLKLHPNLLPQEAEDTAESAREIKEKELPGVAAIASRQAAEHYQLEILGENIADQKANYTRFLVLSRNPESTPEHANKATLILELPYLSGSVSALTDILHKLKAHVSLVQSLPAPVNASAHFAALDIVCENYGDLTASIDALKPLVKHVKVLGLYQQTDQDIKMPSPSTRN